MKYIAYYRVSTKKQGDSGLGLQSQKAIINHFLNPDDIIGEYTDVMSGGIKDRPELRKAVALCKNKGYTLVVAKVDRLSRVTEDALSIYNELDKRLVSCDIPNLDKFTLTIFMAIADRERELISVRTKAAYKIKRVRGDKMGRDNFYSEAGRAKGRAKLQQAAANNENNIRAMALICSYRDDRGMTFQAIADKLNSSAYKTARGKQFTKAAVSRLYKRNCQQCEQDKQQRQQATA